MSDYLAIEKNEIYKINFLLEIKSSFNEYSFTQTPYLFTYEKIFFLQIVYNKKHYSFTDNIINEDTLCEYNINKIHILNNKQINIDLLNLKCLKSD